MAKKKAASKRKYGPAAAKSVKRALHKEEAGTLKRSKGGKGGKVKSRAQAIAIGLSEARKNGAKVPPPPKKAAKKTAAKKTTKSAKKSSSKTRKKSS